jgi:hypothetical protein
MMTSSMEEKNKKHCKNNECITGHKNVFVLTCFVVLARAEVAGRGQGLVGAVGLLVAHLAAGYALEGQVAREVARPLLAPGLPPLPVCPDLDHAHWAPAALLALEALDALVHVGAQGQVHRGGPRGKVLALVETQYHIQHCLTQLGRELGDLRRPEGATKVST